MGDHYGDPDRHASRGGGGGGGYGRDGGGGGGGGGGRSHGQGQGQQPYAPPAPSIQRGTVTRIEPYGAFVQLSAFRARGLVHRSQLARYKIESVEDAVNVDDPVWVKVLEVTKETDEETGKVRHRVRLSVKYASQDGDEGGGGRDLDPEGMEADQEEARRGDRAGDGDGAGRGGGGGFGGGGGPPSALEQSLNSNIGMSIGIDPLAAMRQAAASGGGRGRPGRVVLRGDGGGPTGGAGAPSAGPILFGGYALVDDDEGEAPAPAPVRAPAPAHASSAAASASSGPAAAAAGRDAPPARPLGRGRGINLPAWMTRSDGPTGATDGGSTNKAGNSRQRSRSSRSRSFSRSRSRSHSRSRSRSASAASSRSRDRSRRKKKHKRHRRKESSRSRSSRRRRKDDRDDRRHGSRHHRSGGSRRKESRSRDGKHRHDRRDRSRSRSRDRSRSPSRGRSRSHSTSRDHRDKCDRGIDGKQSEAEFGSVEEARALIAKLEREKAARGSSDDRNR